MVSERSHFASLPLATVPSPFVSSYPPPLRAPGGGRGIVALNLLNCTSVQLVPSPAHLLARDDVGTIAARQQSAEPNALLLVDMLLPFHMMYADGVEKLATENALERQKWVDQIWYVSFEVTVCTIFLKITSVTIQGCCQ
jgi:hypothetical protein